MSLFFILNPKRRAGGHFPPVGDTGFNAKGHALGEWKRKKKKLLALKEEVLPEVTNNEFFELITNIEIEEDRSVFSIAKKKLRTILSIMMMDD